jgi:trimeric autotransporter adhesin
VNGTVTVGGNYNGVNTWGPGDSVAAGGSNSSTDANAATTGVVVATGTGPDFDLSSVNLASGENVTVDLRSTTVTNVAGATNAILLNTGNNALGTVTLTTAKAPVTLTKTTTDYNLVQTAALNLGNVTVNAVAGASTPTAMQNNTLGTIAGTGYGTHDNALNGGQGSRVVLDNAGNNLASIAINNADAANVASNGNLQLGAITAANSVVATSQNGSITQSASAPAIRAAALALNAATGIGARNAPIRYDSAAAIAAGKTPILATSESGNGSTAVTTTGAVQLGGTINEVGFDLANSNLSGQTGTGTQLSATAATNTADTGEINVLSNGTVTQAANVTTNGNAFIQASTGNIVQMAGTLNATAAVLTASAGNIGAAGNAIATNVRTLGLNALHDAYAANTGALTLGTVTQSNGSVGVSTQSGSLTVAAIDVQPTVTGNAAGLNQSGVNANGSGNVVLQANGGDLVLNNNVSSGAGEINLKSTTGNVKLNANVDTAGNAFIEAANNITQVDSTLTAAGAVLTADNGSIGTAGTPIQTSVNTLGVSATNGNAYVSNAGGMNAAGKTKGAMALSTASGKLAISTVTMTPSVSGNAIGIVVNGVTTGGDLSLLAAPSTNGVLEIDQPVNVGGSMIGVGGVDVNVYSDVTANGPITFVADAASGAKPGPGWFRNTADIRSNTGVAIYAVAGGTAPAGYGTKASDQVQLGTISGITTPNAPASRWGQPYPSTSYTSGYYSGNGLFYKAPLATAGPSPVPTPTPTPTPSPTPVPTPPPVQVATGALQPVAPATGTAQSQYGGAFVVDVSTLFDPASGAWDVNHTALPFIQARFDGSLPINGNYAPPRFNFGVFPGSDTHCDADETTRDKDAARVRQACLRYTTPMQVLLTER